ncbi:patatin-like phospholipase family protein [uncultured Sphingomonas sp.]|uniref:patatin-like phospholipase family protein n=1 Tax=uncultured Sphingomonas sp. TaxID=158754 RepID=UPI0025F6A837|nr:patatin-like phospholipase family protein [uncultured Sphingomonas sp.]
MAERGYGIALALSGGNALGAFQGGAYQALQEFGLEPDWVVGCSAGAINGALICGNPAEDRLARLHAFWQPAGTAAESPLPAPQETARRTAAALLALGGRPGLFMPRRLLGRWFNPFGDHEPSSLYDSHPLAQTLESLVDFDRLNGAPPRFSAVAVDVETGEDVIYDTATHRIAADHVRASCALLPIFPPVAIGGRLLADAGLSANLPLDTILSDDAAEPLLCIAVDLLPLEAPRPNTLGDTITRAQDLVFASQSRRALAAWQAIFDRSGDQARAVTILHLAYGDQAQEVSGKAFDYSPLSARARWDAGHAAMRHALAGMPRLMRDRPKPGLTLYRPDDAAPDGLRTVRLPLAPVPG